MININNITTEFLYTRENRETVSSSETEGHNTSIFLYHIAMICIVESS